MKEPVSTHFHPNWGICNGQIRLHYFLKPSLVPIELCWIGNSRKFRFQEVLCFFANSLYCDGFCPPVLLFPTTQKPGHLLVGNSHQAPNFVRVCLDGSLMWVVESVKILAFQNGIAVAADMTILRLSGVHCVPDTVRIVDALW